MGNDAFLGKAARGAASIASPCARRPGYQRVERRAEFGAVVFAGTVGVCKLLN